MKHTSKPWEIEDDEFHKQIVAVDEKGPWVVASVNLCMGSESIANTHLISAAPELLEVAKLIIEEWEKPTDGVQRGELIARLSQYARKAGHAIAKAEGRGDGSYKSKK